jgi:hypothetical protein
MNRLTIVFLALLTALALPRSVWASGPGAGSAGRIQGQGRYVDRPLGLIELEDGTDLWTTNAHQLDGVRPGATVRFEIEKDYDKTRIVAVEPPLPASPCDHQYSPMRGDTSAKCPQVRTRHLFEGG